MFCTDGRRPKTPRILPDRLHSALLALVLVLLAPGVSLADPKLYYFKEGSNYRFLIYDFSLAYADKTQEAITIPSDTSQVRTASYSVVGKNYVTATLPSTSLSLSIQFERTCVLPILAVSCGSDPSLTFVTQTPQEFYIKADQCAAPDISAATRNGMKQVNPFGFNTFNSGQTSFFVQTVSLTPSPNGYNFNMVLYCPYFQVGSSTFGFKLTVDVGQSSTSTVSVYSSSGGLANQTQTITVGAGKTVTFDLNPTETGLSFPVRDSLNTWAVYTVTTASTLLGQTTPDAADSEGLGAPHRLLGTTTVTINATVTNGRYVYAFPSGYTSAQVSLANSGTASVSLAVAFTSVGTTLLIPLEYILIIVGAGVGVILLAVLIPLLVIRLTKKEEPRIVYDQRTFIINNQIIQQDVQLMDARRMNTSGFHIEEMREAEWVRLRQEEQLRRPEAAVGKEEAVKGKEAAKKPAMTVYSIDLKARPRAANERNVLANYLERTI